MVAKGRRHTVVRRPMIVPLRPPTVLLRVQAPAADNHCASAQHGRQPSPRRALPRELEVNNQFGAFVRDCHGMRAPSASSDLQLRLQRSQLPRCCTNVGRPLSSRQKS